MNFSGWVCCKCMGNYVPQISLRGAVKKKTPRAPGPCQASAGNRLSKFSPPTVARVRPIAVGRALPPTPLSARMMIWHSSSLGSNCPLVHAHRATLHAFKLAASQVHCRYRCGYISGCSAAAARCSQSPRTAWIQGGRVMSSLSNSQAMSGLDRIAGVHDASLNSKKVVDTSSL